MNCQSVLNLYDSLVDVARQMESHVVGCSVKSICKVEGTGILSHTQTAGFSYPRVQHGNHP